MRYYIETLGCKVNQFESQAIDALLTVRGHKAAPLGADCDICIVNTCAVTGESGRKSRQAVRRMQRLAPQALTAVCGCWSQIAPQDAEDIGADLVSGSSGRIKFVSDLEQLYASRTRRVVTDEPFKRREFEVLPAGSAFGRTRAMLKIQDGCDNFCSYCIIPYARGAIRSMHLEDAAAEAEKLGNDGYREIVVTGIEISSYGRDFKNGTSLIDVLELISASAPGARIHLGSLEPRTVTPEFARRLAALPNICSHFHLSLQSGCDETLRRMRRKYDTARYFESVTTIRSYFPGCGLTTDLITGFPGETEEEFSNTLAFIRDCRFSDMHIFPYSKRPGTPAAAMAAQNDNKTKHERSVRAQKCADEMNAEFLASCVGKTLSVLFERECGGVMRGHAENYAEVEADASGLRGEIMPVTIKGISGRTLLGKITPEMI